MTKITVVIPTHSSQQWIIETLESVRSQTYPRHRIETIVVDDGSSDGSAALARWYLARHSMPGSVLNVDKGKGLAAAMNAGWKVATGDWIQFIRSDDLLAPNKFNVQASLIPRLPDNVGVICSSWQRLSRFGANNWLPSDTMAFPELADPIVLKLISAGAGCLGAALFRKQAVAAVAGFSEETMSALDEHFMLRIAGIGESVDLMRPRFDIFAQAPSSSPLFFERQMPDETSRHAKIGVARQHLANVLIAQAMLRQMRGGTLTPTDCQEITDLCAESLSDLYEHDPAGFEKYSQWLGINSGPNPTHSMTCRTKDHVNADVLPPPRRWSIPHAAEFGSTLSRGILSLKHGLDRSRHTLADYLQAIGNTIARGMAPLKYRLNRARHTLADYLRAIGNAMSRGMASLKYELDRARHTLADYVRAIGNTMSRCILSLKYELDRSRQMLADCLRAVAQAGVWKTAAVSVTRPPNIVLGAGAVIAIATTALLAGMLIFDPFGSSVGPTDLEAQLQPSPKLRDGAPIIVVASRIYGESSSSWPMPIEIGPPQSVPPGSVLHVRGLPPAATLSGGHRVSADVWAVPLVGLSNLAIQVAAGVSGQSDLTLTLIRADGSSVAKARTSLSIIQPTVATTTVAAAKDLSAGNSDQRGQEVEARTAVMTLPEVTAQTTEPVPPRAPTKSAAAALPASLPVTETGSRSQQATAIPVLDMKTASSIIPEPMPATETQVAAQPSSTVAAVHFDNSAQAAALAALVDPSWSTTKVKHDLRQEVTPEARADLAQPGVKTASTAILEPTPATAISVIPEPPLAVAEPVTAEARQRAEKMLARGESYLREGDVSEARQFFLRAAVAGLARGALLLASTYDSHEFAELHILGVLPNLPIARKWYKRARELGAPQAQERLVRLGVAD